MDFISIDFETATSDRASPCEIGLTFVKNNIITQTKSWLIKPIDNEFDDFNISIHGITPDDVSNSPEFNVLWQELHPILENKFLIAHNAGFDFSVLRRTLELYEIECPNLSYSCSYIFSKKVWPGLSGYDLKTLCKHNNIDISNHHRAAADSKAAAELSIKAFNVAGVSSTEEFPAKLKTSIGSLYPGGYKPSETKWSKSDLAIHGDPLKHSPDNIFYQKNVVFTGALSSMRRADAQQIIADIGGFIISGINKKTDFLIVGQQDYRLVGDDGMSNKQERAMELIAKGHQIEIMSESEFLRHI